MTESNTTTSLLQEYLASVRAVKMSDRELEINKTELVNKKNALGKHLVPKDAKQGEKFTIWVRDESDKEKLLVVEVSADTYIISWRA
jgi:hypothetical protein